MESQTIKVEGMSCNHCKANVVTNLEKLDFITSATVNLDEKSVTITGENIDIKKVKEIIAALGYKPV
ncbi:MAG: heavy metal-associated domain-containing protein [Salinivirgaceae bacterium]|nr:heavy metal-associated domain-containing protein [Salinivirgaceae bacterium]MDY0281012.1 heavy metal-associated domain-containing protein [Salinivirgaceae bacterium]